MNEPTEKEAQIQLIFLYLEEIVIPEILKISGLDFNEVAKWIPELTANYMRCRQGASVAMVRRHIGRAPRWVSQVTNNRPASVVPENGWFSAILNILLDAFPESVTAEEMRQKLMQNNRNIGLISIKKQLKLYHGWGLYEEVGEDEYREVAKTRWTDKEIVAENTEKVRERIGCLPKICNSFINGDAGTAFGMFEGEMDVECLKEFNAKLRNATEELMIECQELSREKEASNQAHLVPFNGLTVIGQCTGPSRKTSGDDS